MAAGGEGYPSTGLGAVGAAESGVATTVAVRGEPVYDDVVHQSEWSLSLAELLQDDGAPRGVRGRRLA